MNTNECPTCCGPCHVVFDRAGVIRTPMTVTAKWYAVTDILPEDDDFVWVHDDGETYLGFFYPAQNGGGLFYPAQCVGDTEGLNSERIYPTHWAIVETPENGPDRHQE